MSKLLGIKDLYGGYQEGVEVLQGISLSVDQGEAVGIIGLNGSGKSTLGKAVMNLLPYRSGEIRFDGKDVSMASTHELAQMGIAMMHQGGVVFNNLSIWQNLQLAIGNASKAETQYFASIQSVIPLLQRSKKELIRTMADKLSGGQRHELALAMTLARQPKLVILDEPSAGLSPKAVDSLYQMLEKLRTTCHLSFLLVEQNTAKALEFCNRCVMMELGKVKETLAPNESQPDEKQILHDCKRYGKQEWDEIYKQHYGDAPWMNDSWKPSIMDLVSQYMPKNAKTLLDYGCGSGYLGYNFYLNGLQVDLSDISSVLIDKIRMKYKDTSMGFYYTNTPDDLAGKKYDVIIAWAVFHHLNPIDWKPFLEGFHRLLNKDGVLVIGGWDSSDIVVKEDGNKARYANHETWFINSLSELFDNEKFLLVDDSILYFDIPPFQKKRVMRSYILAKK